MPSRKPNDAEEGKPTGWARECVVRWWAADKAYRGIALEDYLGRGMRS